MNNLKGHIKDIKVDGSLSIVTVNVNDIILKTILIETPDTANYLNIGNPINVIFKETEVVIGKGEALNISMQNKLNGIIHNIEQGILLSKLSIKTLAGNVNAIITTDAVLQLNIKVQDDVIALIKTNEIMLSEC